MFLRCNRSVVLDTASSLCEEDIGCAHHCQSSAEGVRCACRHGYRLHPNGKDCVRTLLLNFDNSTSAEEQILVVILGTELPDVN